ncbi:MAG: glycoside hydrolase family 127 protein [Acidobacteriaceae bacterium]|nr:glycoside hydrolase family 127 protein [Acidobacteriaceae bacterium]
MLAAELKQSVASTECCCAYNMLKLARHLYSGTADPRLFDYYERLRVPGWLASAPALKLNGKPLEATAEPGGY